jgi:hypothetical protein
MAPKHHHMPLSGGDRKGQERVFEVPADDTHFPERSAEKRREGEAIGLVTICSSYAAGTELPSRRGLNGWKFVALKSPAQRRCWKSFGRSFAAVRKRHHPTNHRVANPSRHFFNPVGPLLVDGARNMRIQAVSTAASWLRSGNGSATICSRRWQPNISPGCDR